MSTEANDEESDGQLVEQRFAENLRRVRDDAGVSQAELARRMAERGWPYHQQTVGKLESGSRSVRLGEAKALAQALHTSLDRLTRPTEEAVIAEQLSSLSEQMGRASAEITYQTEQLLKIKSSLNMTVTIARQMRKTGRGSELLDELLERARRVQGRTPEQAVEGGRIEHAEHVRGEAFMEDLQAEREVEEDEEL